MSHATPAPPPAATPAASTGLLAGVLFDMDGLLVDSEPVWSVAEAELMDRLGGPWNLEVKAACVGKRVDEACRELVRIAGSSVDPADAQDWLVARMAELFRTELPWLPGARELLDALAAEGVPLALVSSSFRVLVDAALETIGAERFAYTVAGDEVVEAKPHPEPYARAAAALGAHPADCVVVEDSATGVASGEAAGCPVLVVPNVVAVPPGPRRAVVESLVEIDVDLLRQLVVA